MPNKVGQRKWRLEDRKKIRRDDKNRKRAAEHEWCPGATKCEFTEGRTSCMFVWILVSASLHVNFAPAGFVYQAG